MRKAVVYNLVFFVFSTCFSQEKYAESITSKDLSRHLHILASDDFEGRETGKQGQKLAAEYIKTQFQSYGIEPIKDNSYYQTIPLVNKYPLGSSFQANTINYEFAEDYFFLKGFNDTLAEISEVTFLGYGIDSEEYSDYSLCKNKGKVAIILDGEPINKKGESYIKREDDLSKWINNWRLKQELAKENGIEVLLIVLQDFDNKVKEHKHRINTPSMFIDNEAERKNKFIPTFYVSEKLASELLKQNVQRIRHRINKKGKPYSFSQEVNVRIDVNRKEEKLSAENVLAYIEGSDLKDELIVITAHYDHIGMSDGEIYNGADDDGSGTVALLEIAEAFSQAKKDGKGNRRSILIMSVAGEEKGLLGSMYYTENPLFSLENTLANLNIDMIGRLDKTHENNTNYVYLIGSDKLSSELHQISENANETFTKLELDYTFNQPDDPNRFYYRSDHYNFAKNNIPVIFYFCGVHDDYHKPTDTVDKIDFEKMEKITKLVFYTAWELANRKERIQVDVVNEFK